MTSRRFLIFGYVTATLATLLVGQENSQKAAHIDAQLIANLRAEISALGEKLEQNHRASG